MEHASVFAIPAHHRFRRHEHPGVHLCAVVKGAFSERSGRTWTSASAGTVRVSGAARHDIDFGPDGASCLVLELDGAEVRVPPQARFIEPDPWIARLVARFAWPAEGADPPAAGMDALAIELWAQVLRRIEDRRSPAPAWLRRVPEMVNDSADPPGVAEIAAEVGVHRVHLARVFRDHYGLSVTEYAQRVRLERARGLLVRGRSSLAEVAAAAGFADQSHMTRAIRAAHGVTPAVMRGTLHPFKTRLARRG